MSTTVVLTINRADNELIALLNGIIVYDKKTDGNPSLNDVVNLTNLVTSGDNILTLLGINWGDEADYAGTLTVDATTTTWGASYKNTANGLAWSDVIHIHVS